MSTEAQAKFDHLKARVKQMLDCQQLYFKTRDVQILRKSKALEAEVRDLVDPKPPSQSQLEFLGR